MERVWGGHALTRLARGAPGVSAPAARARQPVGESWEISDVEGQPSRVARGDYAGWSLRRLVEEFPDELLGPGADTDRFPLLIKLLDARQNLSVQVHPRDEDLARGPLAAREEAAGRGKRGKTEAWIILDAEPGAEVIHGLAPGVDRRDLMGRLREIEGGALAPGEDRDLFQWVPVEVGDVVFVPAGTIHALGGGIVLLECQETSDITYRVYDWGRPGADGRPRELHLDEAELVGEPENAPCPWARLGAAPARGARPRVETVLECDKFRIEAVLLAEGTATEADTTAGGAPGFHILVGLDGRARCLGPRGETLELERARPALLPAALGAYRLTGAGRSLRITLPG